MPSHVWHLSRSGKGRVTSNRISSFLRSTTWLLSDSYFLPQWPLKSLLDVLCQLIEIYSLPIFKKQWGVFAEMVYRSKKWKVLSTAILYTSRYHIHNLCSRKETLDKEMDGVCYTTAPLPYGLKVSYIPLECCNKRKLFTKDMLLVLWRSSYIQKCIAQHALSFVSIIAITSSWCNLSDFRWIL